jgi:hypothetical protein
MILYLSDTSTPSATQAMKIQLEETSPHYREFLTELGWIVDLQSHRGFAGGLDPRVCRSSVYYSDCFHELMWHAGGLIANQWNVIEKDHTHVIWCDGNFDFSSFATPMSEGKAFIVIHPLPVGLFAVRIILAKGIEAQPGFLGSVVLPKRILPVFVRQTVLGIRIAALDEVAPFQIPPPDVNKELRALIKEGANDRNLWPSEFQIGFLSK